MSEYKFTGWLGHNPESAKGNMKWEEFQPKPFSDDDVDIKISHCGICGSDIHTLRSGWGKSLYPVCVGHEIIGTAVRVGKNVTAKRGIKMGDRVGVGAQNDSCGNTKGDCPECADGFENYCPRGNVGTYNGKYSDGSKSYGGYATYHRAPANFVFKIPDAIDSADAAPMMCGGLTVYSPLRRNGCGPSVNVGIVGVGGLGHFGLLFAKALGAAKVVAISRSSTKKADATALGADAFIATGEEKNWSRVHSRTLDLIICTVSSPDMPIEKYLHLLRTGGKFVQVGAPEDRLPQISAFAFITKGCFLTGSSIGSPAEIEEMLEFAAKKGIKPWIEKRSLKDANKAIVDMEDGKARYRYVLVNEAGSKL
ncbi:putative cinnamyl-alcohol dehydrogenase 1 [Venturia nashicola]|uniref:alcohol dehydrogenase (NADP(+)) n=1 Tax=Venturia nashicola TaxID=86259 RepID=A0A4Z1PQ30_9PEZI|nr:putative cinnamyl-alcohol dehydrogenase 1 [Venturia nashicola]TLD37305.1 putative cinnamyl-alcohol dehydrogenase 1 [Venturia nashicola]